MYYVADLSFFCDNHDDERTTCNLLLPAAVKRGRSGGGLILLLSRECLVSSMLKLLSMLYPRGDIGINSDNNYAFKIHAQLDNEICRRINS